MKTQGVILILFLFMSTFCLAQDSEIKLPYYELPKYSKKDISGKVMLRAIDELGFKYYWATNGFTDKNLIDELKSPNVARYILENLYQLSNLISCYTSKEEIQLNKNIKTLSFEVIRSRTLMKIKISSETVLNYSQEYEVQFWDILINPLSDALWYCDQLIAFRRQIGNPCDERVDPLITDSELSKFQDKRGADGITNEQWLEISKIHGAMGMTADLIRSQNRTNNIEEAALKKGLKGKVKVGELEEIGLEPNTVEGKSYVYYGNPPEQLSFIITSDAHLIQGLIQWILYINSGNPTSLLDIFRLNIYPNLNGDIVYYNIENSRIVTDKNGNSVNIKRNPNFIDISNSDNFKITQVMMGNSKNEINRILFIAKQEFNIRASDIKDSIILSIQNRSGDLLNRIRMNIENSRGNEKYYNEERANLNLSDQ